MPEEQELPEPLQGYTAGVDFAAIQTTQDALANQAARPYMISDPAEPARAYAMAGPLPQEAIGVRADGTAIMPGDTDANNEAMKKKKEAEKPKWAIKSSEFRVIEDVVIMRQLLDSRKPGLRNRRCLVNVGHAITDVYATSIGSNTPEVYSIDQARFFEVSYVIERRGSLGEQCRFVFVNEEQLAKAPPTRQMLLEREINPTLIKLMQVAPKNEIVQAHIMAIFGRLPPAELETYDQIKDWIEFNFQSPIWNSTQQRRMYSTEGRANNAPETPRARTVDGFGIPVEAIEIELGNANYRARVRSEFTFQISADRIARVLQPRRNATEPLTFDEMVEELTQYVNENYSDQDPGAQAENYQYSEHEVTDREDSNVEFSTTRVREGLENYIRTNYGPEEAEAIIGRQ